MRAQTRVRACVALRRAEHLSHASMSQFSFSRSTLCVTRLFVNEA